MKPTVQLQFHILFVAAFSICLASERFKPFIRSSVYLEIFASIEIEFVERLHLSLNELKGPSQSLAVEYLKTYKDNTENLNNFASAENRIKKALATTANFISVFQLVHRWIFYLALLKKKLKRKQGIVEPLLKYSGFTRHDLNSSMLDILYIFHVYNFDVPLGVDGGFREFTAGTRLSAGQCFELGKYGREKGYHALSIQFLEQAVLREGGSVSGEEIWSFLNDTIKEHDQLVKDPNYHPYQKQYLFNKRIAPLKKRFGDKQRLLRVYERGPIALMNPNYLPRLQNSSEEIPVPFELDLCLHKNLQSEEEKKSLFCWYESSVHPYFAINPLKAELLSAAPELIQIYELLSPKQIARIKDKANARSYQNTTSQQNTNIRYIESTMDFHEIKIFPAEFNLLSAFHKWGPEALIRNQVHSYTPGSKMYRHYDLPQEIRQPHTKISVSLLYYLEEPVLGGETTFLYPKITVRPVVGSGIYWISSLNRGSVDPEMLHGCCPVLAGRKYVISKFLLLDRKGPKQQSSPYQFEKYKHFPSSKILNERLYAGMENYYRNENLAGSEIDYFLVPRERW